MEPGNALAPAVVLVNPQLGENIGAAARAMLNFGLADLRLVAPRDGWPNPAAVPMAAGAAKLLDEAKVYETTEEAVADLRYLLAATARRREMEVPVIGTVDVGTQLRAASRDGVATGILFGPGGGVFGRALHASGPLAGGRRPVHLRAAGRRRRA